MHLKELIKDKSKKSKQKTEELAQWLLNGELSAEELLAFAATEKGPVKATCMEALAWATEKQADLLQEKEFRTVISSLADEAARVKWESARVIAHSLHCFPKLLNEALKALLNNSSHAGTVVRWSAAQALLRLAELPGSHQPPLFAALKSLHDNEEKNSIKKIYLRALKQLNSLEQNKVI